MYSRRITRFSGVASCAFFAAGAFAQEDPDRTPVAEFKDGFTLEQVESYRSQFNIPELLKGGDTSVWWSQRTSELHNTAHLPVQVPVMPLEENIMPEIGEITADTKNFGTLSLNDWLVHPGSYAKGIIVIHEGKVVFEEYPALNPWDAHLWMSTAKPLTSLVIDKLIEEGKITDQQTVGELMPDWAATDWADIKVIDILDMTPGMNSEENDETRADPDSIAIRTFNAEFGFQYNRRNETVPEVLMDAESVRNPGEKFEYGSPTTEMLVLIAEAVGQEPWAQLLDKYVWSKVGAEGPLMVHMSPDGTAAAHGVVSSRLRVLARFGMLYTPSWDKTATEQVVTPEILARIRDGVRGHEFYMNGFDGPAFLDRLNDDTMISNARQWDAIWPDGDMWKAGLQSQALYVSPDKDLVIAFFSTNVPDDSFHRYLRPIATSDLFD
ncbi:CubicO group peptidase (beta-lactamase class C family) [Aliiruegeria haliotis]|uniref:CubicO group peptidase (Beta-lactamase class C family) n=1 Tax=Aliiruegeria haliotis TaxID=1280846 RepID=A0A2T0RF29_9RHOB|nr:serine hydrolase [Aliiruegeria haliotis]PRY19767.1 CubicO group peptidase (beta-lactamase class C family) [Aliiruegeria haliotis]